MHFLASPVRIQSIFLRHQSGYRVAPLQTSTCQDIPFEHVATSHLVMNMSRWNLALTTRPSCERQWRNLKNIAHNSFARFRSNLVSRSSNCHERQRCTRRWTPFRLWALVRFSTIIYCFHSHHVLRRCCLFIRCSCSSSSGERNRRQRCQRSFSNVGRTFKERTFFACSRSIGILAHQLAASITVINNPFVVSSLATMASLHPYPWELNKSICSLIKAFGTCFASYFANA